jgi:hypothetical protein
MATEDLGLSRPIDGRVLAERHPIRDSCRPAVSPTGHEKRARSRISSVGRAAKAGFRFLTGSLQGLEFY